jgi:hypothetical protein
MPSVIDISLKNHPIGPIIKGCPYSDINVLLQQRTTQLYEDLMKVSAWFSHSFGNKFVISENSYRVIPYQVPTLKTLTVSDFNEIFRSFRTRKIKKKSFQGFGPRSKSLSGTGPDKKRFLTFFAARRLTKSLSRVLPKRLRRMGLDLK